MFDSSAKAPANHRDIIGLWPSIKSFADETGIPYETAKQMRRRNSIGDEHRAAVIERAQARGFDAVTFELLVRTAPKHGAGASA